MENISYTTSAPARICLFGDHQDYLNLPVIACAIDRFINIKAKKNNSEEIKIDLPDLNENRSFRISNKFLVGKQGDYLSLGLGYLRKKEMEISHGLNVEINGNIPINAGISSSSALMAAWIELLLKIYKPDLSYTRKQLGQMAYEAEVLEQGSSGGKMDQFTIAHKGLIYIDTKTDEIESLNKPNCEFIIANSGESKDTLGMLKKLKSTAIEGKNKIKSHIPDFDYEQFEKFDISEVKKQMYPFERQVVEAAIENFRITKKARILLNSDNPDVETLGILMNRHHKMLEENLSITTPLIDNMIKSANLAGAHGSKIIGSGGGGCIVALCDNNKSDMVLNALLESGAVEVFKARIVD